MTNLDEATLERIIEQITRQVLILLQEEQERAEAGAGGTSAPPISAHNYVERVQPVVNAGADRVASTLGIAPTDGRLAHLIDHTLLKADATQDQIAQLCYEARKYSFVSVCVNPTNVKLCAQLLEGSDVLVCTVVGFPLGATSTEVKVFEAQQAIRDGATEVDMVINVGALKSRDYELVERDIASIARPTHAGWLKQYVPMVEEGTWAWLEIGQSDLFQKPLPQEVVASAFANRELYLVLANYGKAPAEVHTSDTYLPVADPSAAPAKRWDLGARSLQILRRS